jgi:hypothetical protein
MDKKYVYHKLNSILNLIKSDSIETKSKENFIYKAIRLKIYILFILFTPVNNLLSQLLISQYIETTSSTTPKGIEIYNYSNSPIVFSNSNNLQISDGVNGGPCELITGTNITSGALAAGSVWVIGTSDLTAYALANGVNLSGTTTFAFQFNGNDALTLSLGGVVIDVFGTCGSDPGLNWFGNGVSTQNQNIQINASISTGTNTYWTDPSLRFQTVSTTNLMTGFGTAPSFSTLPIELVSFASNCENNNTVSVNWTTASEHNSDYFIVEKSRDGSTWNELKKIAAGGNSTQLINYSVTDASDINGTVYYRLSQYDIDGASKVYDIVSTNCSAENELAMVAYPNPSNGQFTVKIENAIGGNYTLGITDVQGKPIEQQIIQLETGTKVVKLNPIGLKPGVYLLQIVNASTIEKQLKLVVN